MARLTISILGIGELKWVGRNEFNSDDHYIYYCGKESIRRSGLALIINKRLWNAVLGCNLKNNIIIPVCFQGKPFDITVIQVYAPTTNAKEAEVNRFYEDLQYLLELTPKKKKSHFHYRGLECKSRNSRDTWSNRQVWPQRIKWSRANASRVCKHLFPATKEMTLHMDITRWSIPKSDRLCSLSSSWITALSW